METPKKKPGRKKNATVYHGCRVCLLERVKNAGDVCPECAQMSPAEMMLTQCATWNLTPPYYHLVIELLVPGRVASRLEHIAKDVAARAEKHSTVIADISPEGRTMIND